MLNNLDYPIRRARLLCGFGKKLRRVHATFAGCRMRTDHDRITRHQRNQDLVVDGGNRISGRGQCQDHTGGPGNLNYLAGLVNPWIDKVLVAVKIDQRMRSQFVLDFLVRRHTESGLLHRPVSIAASVLMRRFRDRIDYGHCQCLIKAAKNLGGPACPLEHNVGLPGQRRWCVSNIY